MLRCFKVFILDPGFNFHIKQLQADYVSSYMVFLKFRILSAAADESWILLFSKIPSCLVKKIFYFSAQRLRSRAACSILLHPPAEFTCSRTAYGLMQRGSWRDHGKGHGLFVHRDIDDCGAFCVKKFSHAVIMMHA